MYEALLQKSEHNYQIAIVAQKKQCYDVAVSCYYYALFQKINFILREKYDKFKEPDFGKDSHKEIKIQFNAYINDKYPDLNEEYIADIAQIENLKRLRVVADYKPEVINETKFKRNFMKRFSPCYEIIRTLI